MKRILSLALALLIACGCLTAVYATPACFGDVPSDAYFRPAVEWAIQGGITAGVDESHFGPHQPCTRAQAMTFLWRAVGSPDRGEPIFEFSDVKPSDYYFKAVTWAVELGITAGVGDGRFGAEDTCTRGQIVTFLWRLAGSESSSGSSAFTDVTASDYFFHPVAWAVANQVTAGVGNNQFGPNQPCTRAQIMTMLWRADQIQSPETPETPEVPPVTGEETIQTSTDPVTGLFRYDEARQIFDLVNQARRDAGVPELTWNMDMEQAAKIRAAECYLNFDHVRPDGSSCFTAHDQIRGENIAGGSTGYFDAQAIFDGWMNSDGHRENILSDSFTGITVAAVSVKNVTYWVQLFS